MSCQPGARRPRHVETPRWLWGHRQRRRSHRFARLGAAALPFYTQLLPTVSLYNALQRLLVRFRTRLGVTPVLRRCVLEFLGVTSVFNTPKLVENEPQRV